MENLVLNPDERDEYLTDEVTAREAGIGIWATNETAYPE